MRVAIFGGTFDPIHVGHLMVAEQVRQIFDFDQVIFMPSAIPPHKPGNGHVSARHRFIMANLATLSNPCFQVSSLEIDREGPSYTIDTLRALRSSFKPETKFFFLIGSDAFLEIETWQEARELFQLCQFIVICRPGVGREETLKYLQRDFFQRAGAIQPQIINFPFPEPECIDYTARLFLVEAILVNISSSSVRQLCSQGRTIRYLVPRPVEEYIYKHNLYPYKGGSS